MSNFFKGHPVEYIYFDTWMLGLDRSLTCLASLNKKICKVPGLV